MRIGFDDNRSLGQRETGSPVALPAFQELLLGVYHDGLVGPVPRFPDEMEQRITQYLQGDAPAPGADAISAQAAQVGVVSEVPTIPAYR